MDRLANARATAAYDRLRSRRLHLLALMALILVALSRLPGLFAQERLPLLITEVYYDPFGDEEAEEWFEVANLGTLSVDLTDVKVGDEEQLGAGEGMVRFPDGAAIAAGQAVVVARSATGFRALYGRNPDYEIANSDPEVPDMKRYAVWATGDVALNNDGDEVLVVGPDNVIIDGVSYGESIAFFSPSVADVNRGVSIERVPASCDTDSAADWQPQPEPTPGTLTLTGECAQSPDPGAAAELVSIGSIQGTGERAARVNQDVAFTGIVTGFYEDLSVSSGIIYYTVFVQDTVDGADGDPSTSDALAVFVGTERPRLALGDEVLVKGQVTEYYGLTEIDDDGQTITVLSRHNPLPEAVTLSPPAAEGASYYERLEAMRVTLPEGYVVGPTFSGCGFAVLPEGLPPDRIVRESLDDDISSIIPVLHTSDVDCTGFPQVKVGDVVRGLTGPLTYSFDQFRIVEQHADTLDVVPAPLGGLPAPPAVEPGQFTVATFNVENYFDTVDETGSDAEPKPTKEELELKQEKIARIIAEAIGCPTLLGIEEVEHEALLEELAGRLTPLCGFRYNVSHRESFDARGIDVALLTQPQRVTVGSVALQQACSPLRTGVPEPPGTCPMGEDPLFSRPPLEATVVVDGQPYTVYVNHFKSKSGGESETAAQRLAQAEHLHTLVATRMEADPGARVLAIGDFNDYPLSSPLAALTAGDDALVNVLLQVPRPERYSYIFGGASQLLDMILVSPSVAEQVELATVVHANADYPAGWADEHTVPFRASDHDIPLVVLRGVIAPPTATVVSVATATPAAPASGAQGAGLRQPWVMVAAVAGIVTIATGALLILRGRQNR